jgi:transposase
MLAEHLPAARYLLADKAYDADHWRAWLKRRRIRAVIPNKVNRKQPHPFARRRYRRRNVIERMFGRLKDFRRVATRYDKNAHNFMAALCLAALVCYWI